MKRILSSLLMLTMLLSALSLNFAVQADTQTTTPEILYYNDFNVENDLGDFTMYSAPEGYSPEISDGALYFPGGVGDVSMRYTTAEPLIDFSKETTKPELVLEMRVKTHFGQTGFFSTWANNTYARIKTFQINNKGELYTHYKEGTKLADTVKGEWNTITVVYGNDASAPSRYIYLNGTKVGECVGASADSPSENCYATTGKLTLALLPYLPLNGTYIYIDYIKISEKPTSITAQTLNVDNDNVVVSFTSTPTSISENNFSLASGTEINGIDKINETTYRLYTASDLSGTDTLTVSGITDTIGNQISSQTIEFTVEERQAFVDAEVPYYNSFDSEDAISGKEFSEKTAATDYASVTVENGSLKFYSVLNTDTTTGTSSKIYFTPGYSNDDVNRQPLVLEYKIKFDVNNSNHYFYQVTNNNRPYAAGAMIYPYKTIEKTTLKTHYPEYHYMQNQDEWHTLTLVYDNDSNAVDFYWDGEFKITNTSDYAYTNPWDDSAKLGTVYFMNSMGSKAGGITTYIDDLKVFEKPEYFSAQVANNEQTELNKITIDFNSTAANVSTANVRVNGKVPASVKCVDEGNQKYEVTLAEALQPETEYKVSLNGVLNTIGQETYDVLSFTTKALEAGEAYYTIGNGGIVTAGGEEIADGTYADAVNTIVVKANKGYKAVVKVNGTPVTENNKYGEYAIDTTNGAEIEVTFEEAVTPSFSTPVSFVDESAPDTSYTFVRLNMATDSFGVIVSSDQNKLNAEDADGVTTFILPATNGSNAFGEYGISIKDRAEGNVLGNKYYVRPYAKLGDTYYYQNPVTVNVTTVQ